jgi:hypothetical protein
MTITRLREWVAYPSGSGSAILVLWNFVLGGLDGLWPIHLHIFLPGSSPSDDGGKTSCYPVQRGTAASGSGRSEEDLPTLLGLSAIEGKILLKRGDTCARSRVVIATCTRYLFINNNSAFSTKTFTEI